MVLRQRNLENRNYEMLANCLNCVCFTCCLRSIKGSIFEEVISLRSVGNPVISSDGKKVAFTMRTADWGQNEFDNEIWISKNGGNAFQATYVHKGVKYFSSIFTRWKVAGLPFKTEERKANLCDAHWKEVRLLRLPMRRKVFQVWNGHHQGTSLFFIKQDEEEKEKRTR